MTTSAISTAISAGTALMNKLAAVSAANAATATNNRLTLIGNDINNQLNQQISQLQAQSEDPEVTILQQQETSLSTQLTNYQNAETQIGQNNTVLSELGLQLSDASVAAQAGDSTSFDQAVASAQNYLGLLQVVPSTPGLQPDGIAALQFAGLGIQSSSTYDLSTAAGQAQALAAVQTAQTQVQNIQTQSSQNQTISASIQTALQTQITGVSNQINNLQQTELTDAATQIANLKQQAQEEYHIIEMNFGNSTTAASVLTSLQTEANLAAVQPGTTLGIIDPTPGEPSLFVANLKTSTPSTASTSSASSSSLPGSSSSTSSSSSSSATTAPLGSIISTSA